MKPKSPVFTKKYVEHEIVFAKDQPEFIPLPALRIDAEQGIFLIRWTMTWRERLRAFFSGSVYLQVMTFNKGLQPVALFVEPPKETE